MILVPVLRAQTPKPDAKPEPDVLIFADDEKLIGHLVRSTGASVTFKSDMAGEITVEWSKIRELRTQRPFAVVQKNVKLHRHEDGRVHALSSDGHTAYVVRNTADGAWCCTCPAGRNERRCYHVTTAMLRFGGFFACPAVTAVIVPADPDPEPPTPAAPAVRLIAVEQHSCGNCGMVRPATELVPPAMPVWVRAKSV